ncbi:MAG TPA: hypothetical protein DEO60_13665 [Bacteroidales bacterium]|nr:hypothetical protein [Bacteroidales bacterium]HBZ22174.1 hypothetical protein [Bacteroidales bacterium]
MLEKKLYTNGQPVYSMTGEKLTFFYKNGKIKAQGPFINNLMEGEWTFYRETGQLWQIANFRNSKKNGSMIRYGKDDKIEYQEEFENNKVIKNK